MIQNWNMLLWKEIVFLTNTVSRAQSATDNFDEGIDQEETVRIDLLTQASLTFMDITNNGCAIASWIINEEIAKNFPAIGSRKSKFDDVNISEVLSKRDIIKNKYANKHATVCQ
ncbi:hypothetical protein NPIL_146851, partial [Nephila pilipes]